MRRHGVHRGVPHPTGALADALTRVGDRWTLLVVAALLEGPRRFGELQAAVPGVASNVLSARLRTLERAGLVVATPYATRPPRMDYRLTAAGGELGGALRLLAAWASGPGGDAEAPAHEACGSPLQVRWWCPTCGRAAEDGGDVWV